MKNVPVVSVVERDDAAELPELSEEVRVALSEVADVAREGLLAMSVGVGLRVMAEMMDAEVTATVARSTPRSRTGPPGGTRRHRARWCWVAGA